MHQSGEETRKTAFQALKWLISTLSSGKKKEPKPKLFGPDTFGWGGGLPREGVGAKNFGMSFETQGNQTFWRDIPGFCRDMPGALEKFEKKKFVFNSRPLFLAGKAEPFASNDPRCVLVKHRMCSMRSPHTCLNWGGG